MDAPAAMLTTYPEGTEEQVEQHRELLKLEKDGKVTRHLDMEKNDQGAKYVIWLPVDEAGGRPAPAVDDEGERP